MKAWFLMATAAFSCMLPVIAIAEFPALPQSLVAQELEPNAKTDLSPETNSLSRLEPSSQRGINICQIFSHHHHLEEDLGAAPPPVRTLADGDPEQVATLEIPELVFYQQLGLTQSRDRSHVCFAKDPENSRRQFTIFKVKKINNILVVSTFLNSGKFIAGQEAAATNLFVEMIRFYTDIPDTYYQGIRHYPQEFYLRMTDGRLTPSSDRAYPVDEPTEAVIMYHTLQGQMSGTGISLNIPLP